VIEATELHKTFGRIVAVDSVTFTADDAAITGILGPNGAGKTTTMRMLCGLVRPDRGTASVGGADVVRDPRGVLRVSGILPDSRGLYSRLTARENVRYYGELHGLHPAAIETRIDELVELLDMKSIADRRTHGFSQGERMKVAIARALVHDPHHLLLDEPTNGLDVMSTRAMRVVIRRLRESGRCVVLSTHVMQEVVALCDKVVVIARGRVAAAGTSEEILETTATRSLEDAFVAIIGSGEGLA
jgi:sodium transport system ATP-binding protein